MTDSSLVNRINKIKENIKLQRAQAAKVAVEAGEKSVRKGFAEKVVLGWERPEVALQYTIFVKEVKELQPEGCYRKTEMDEEGFVVGVLPERIQTTREAYDADRQYIESIGFKAEHHPEMWRYIQ